MRAGLLLLVLASACTRAPALLDEDELEQDLDGGCGVERWPIKTATDANAISIAAGAPVKTTIEALAAFPAQTGNDFDRIQPTELTAYQLTDVTLIQYRRESDGDYHLVVREGTRTMIVEVPDPACAAGSPLASSLSAVRAQFDAQYGPVQGTPASAAEVISLTGVGFFDFFHSQTGVLPNSFELHPVLSLCFGAGCMGGTPPPPPPRAAKTGCASGGDAGWALLLALLRRRRATA